MTKEELHEAGLACAKALQAIEHNGRHTWESCHASARERALRQAGAVIEVLMSRGWRHGLTARELRAKHGWPEPSEEQKAHNLYNNTGIEPKESDGG